MFDPNCPVRDMIFIEKKCNILHKSRRDEIYNVHPIIGTRAWMIVTLLTLRKL